jgi:hypothetical protein
LPSARAASDRLANNLILGEPTCDTKQERLEFLRGGIDRIQRHCPDDQLSSRDQTLPLQQVQGPLDGRNASAGVVDN